MTPVLPPVLDRFRAAASGVGQATFAQFVAALVGAARMAATDGRAPPRLLVIGEPLAGKTTILAALIATLTGPFNDRPIAPYLTRWGDAIRAAKSVGIVAPERQFGDLSAAEFSGVSRLVLALAEEARRDAPLGRPALVIMEAPGVTAIREPDGSVRGLDRGYTIARTMAQHPDGYLLAVCADQRVRDSRLASRAEESAAHVREATRLAANRIREQVTELAIALAQAGALDLPAPAPAAHAIRARMTDEPAYRNEAVARAFLPYLVRDDLSFPDDRVFIGINRFLDGEIAPDPVLLDRYDWPRSEDQIRRAATAARATLDAGG